jgi:hypothetical protein
LDSLKRGRKNEKMANITIRIPAFTYTFESRNVYNEDDAFDSVDYDTLGSLALERATIVTSETEYDIEEEGTEDES